MKVEDLSLDGLKLITPKVFQDERGFFFESFKKPLLGLDFLQDNVSFSIQGTLRGLHYQSTPGQAKLVRCSQGKIWDVAVDLRKESKTFGKWFATFLDDIEHQMLFIPVGFAHGFCVVSPTASVQYKVSHPYNPQTECGIFWNDPDLAIAWPIQNPLLSERDQKSARFKEVFCEVMGSRM